MERCQVRFADYAHMWMRAGLNPHCHKAVCGVATVRRRKLPAEDVVWLVIGISLYRDRPMVEVVHRLDLVLPSSDGTVGQVTKDALPQARERVGVEPMKSLIRVRLE